MPKEHQQLIEHSVACNIFQLAVQNAFNHVIITNVDGKIAYANAAVQRITGYDMDEVIGKTPRLWGGEMPATFYKKMWHRIKVDQKPFEGEINNRKKDGTPYVAHIVISPVFDQTKKLIGFIGTEEDITKQKELENLKSEFVSITAHQLKTPLTGIKWNVELLTSALSKTRKNQILAKAVTESIEQLVGLVDRLLNITRIESGRISFQPEKINAAKLITDITKGIRPQFEAHHQELIVATKPTWITTDPSFIREIVMNLLSNAQKYTPDHGKIRVTVAEEAKHLVIRVADTGHGIPKKDQPFVFKKYFRAQNVKSLAAGAGLGLYFVKLLVDTCRAQIAFESQEEEGTTFTVTFPTRAPRAKKGEITLSETSIA